MQSERLEQIRPLFIQPESCATTLNLPSSMTASVLSCGLDSRREHPVKGTRKQALLGAQQRKPKPWPEDEATRRAYSGAGTRGPFQQLLPELFSPDDSSHGSCYAASSRDLQVTTCTSYSSSPFITAARPSLAKCIHRPSNPLLMSGC